MAEVNVSGIDQTLLEYRKSLERLYHLNEYTKELIRGLAQDAAKIQKQIIEGGI